MSKHNQIPNSNKYNLRFVTGTYIKKLHKGGNFVNIFSGHRRWDFLCLLYISAQTSQSNWQKARLTLLLFQ